MTTAGSTARPGRRRVVRTPRIVIYQELSRRVARAGRGDVYVGTVADIDLDRLPAAVHGQPVTAVALDPGDDRLIYLTTGPPERLAALGEPFYDLRP